MASADDGGGRRSAWISEGLQAIIANRANMQQRLAIGRASAGCRTLSGGITKPTTILFTYARPRSPKMGSFASAFNLRPGFSIMIQETAPRAKTIGAAIAMLVSGPIPGNS